MKKLLFLLLIFGVVAHSTAQTFDLTVCKTKKNRYDKMPTENLIAVLTGSQTYNPIDLDSVWLEVRERDLRGVFGGYANLSTLMTTSYWDTYQSYCINRLIQEKKRKGSMRYNRWEERVYENYRHSPNVHVAEAIWSIISYVEVINDTRRNSSARLSFYSEELLKLWWKESDPSYEALQVVTLEYIVKYDQDKIFLLLDAMECPYQKVRDLAHVRLLSSPLSATGYIHLMVRQPFYRSIYYKKSLEEVNCFSADDLVHLLSVTDVVGVDSVWHRVCNDAYQALMKINYRFSEKEAYGLWTNKYLPISIRLAMYDVSFWNNDGYLFGKLDPRVDFLRKIDENDLDVILETLLDKSSGYDKSGVYSFGSYYLYRLIMENTKEYLEAYNLFVSCYDGDIGLYDECSKNLDKLREKHYKLKKRFKRKNKKKRKVLLLLAL